MQDLWEIVAGIAGGLLGAWLLLRHLNNAARSGDADMARHVKRKDEESKQ